jgi:quinol monooxygenase YgiN
MLGVIGKASMHTVPEVRVNIANARKRDTFMAIGVIFEGTGLTEATYEQVKNAVAPNNSMPAGMQYHVAGATENGFAVIEVWDSQEAAKKFFDEQLGQSLQKAGITIQPRFIQVHNIMQTREAARAL